MIGSAERAPDPKGDWRTWSPDDASNYATRCNLNRGEFVETLVAAQGDDREAKSRLSEILARAPIADLWEDTDKPRDLSLASPATTKTPRAGGFSAEHVRTAAELRELGLHFREHGVPWVWERAIPALGMCGFSVGYPKAGKSTLGVACSCAIARGDQEFLGLEIPSKRRVLYLGLEDPPEYLGYLFASAANGSEDLLAYPAHLSLNDLNLADLAEYVREENIGFVYVASLLAGLRGVIRDENSNAEMGHAVESLKLFARKTGVPTLVEAHAGRGEDRSRDADPIESLRGASAAAAAADFVLQVSRIGGGFSRTRLLRGRGRFVELEPVTFEYDPASGQLGEVATDRSAAVETDWRQILETGAVTEAPRSTSAIAVAAGLCEQGGVNGAIRSRVHAALKGRDGVAREVQTRRDQAFVRYRIEGRS